MLLGLLSFALVCLSVVPCTNNPRHSSRKTSNISGTVKRMKLMEHYLRLHLQHQGSSTLWTQQINVTTRLLLDCRINFFRFRSAYCCYYTSRAWVEAALVVVLVVRRLTHWLPVPQQRAVASLSLKSEYRKFLTAAAALLGVWPGWEEAGGLEWRHWGVCGGHRLAEGELPVSGLGLRHLPSFLHSCHLHCEARLFPQISAYHLRGEIKL